MNHGDEGRAEGIAVEGIGQIAVPVRDVERATAFYRDVLGLPHLFSAPPGLSFFRCGAVRLMLSTPESEDEEPVPAPLIYYRVEDVGAAHRRLAEVEDRGDAGVVAEPHVVHRTDDQELWMGFYRDSEGHTFATMAEVEAGTEPEG